MTYRKTMLSASIVAALMLAGAAVAHDSHPGGTQAAAPQTTQSTNPDPQTTNQEEKNKKLSQQKAANLKGVVVVGIRASLAQSLQTKRDANAIVDAITAEDISKFPNVNAAEALSMVPGVSVDRLFGQGARVSIDGINADLNQTLLDGHPVATTVWRYAQNPHRGFNYLVIAPEMLGRMEVFKNQKASLPAGSIGGTVIMHSRHPLDLEANSLSLSVRENYNDQASTGKPAASLLYSWKTQDNTFGVDLALSDYKEQLDRQGVEVLGYSPISDYVANNPTIAADVAAGKLSGNAMVPDEMNSAWFQQTLHRKSALANVQFRPNENFEGNLSLLWIKENFTNYNQSMYNFSHQSPAAMADVDSFVGNGHGLVIGGHTTPVPGSGLGLIFDNQLRPSEVTTKSYDLKLDYHNDNFAIGGRGGYSKSENPFSAQYFIEPVYSGGLTWNIHKGWMPDDPAAARDPSNYYAAGWMGNLNVFHSGQQLHYGQLHFDAYFDSFINTLELGVRLNDSKTHYGLSGYGGVTATVDGRNATLADVGTVGVSDAKGGLKGLYSGMGVHPIPGAGNVKNWVLGSADLDYPAKKPLGDNIAFLYQNTWQFRQKTRAFFAMADYASDNVRGNFGARVVRTKNIGSAYNVPVGADVTFDNVGQYYGTASNTVTKVLPSITAIFDNGGNTVVRGSLSKNMAWAPPNMMVNQTFLNGTTFTGSGGNPDLKPYTSYNTNLSVEWYFAPQSVLAISGFYKNILNYIAIENVTRNELNPIFESDPGNYNKNLLGTHGCDSTGHCDFVLQLPVGGGGAHDKGVTIQYQQAFGNGFGLASNLTYSTAKTASGNALPFHSKIVFNLSPYFEKGPFSARVNVSSRSRYQGLGYVSGAVPPITDDLTFVSASLGWKFNPHWSLTLDGQNLTNTKYYQYQYGPVGQTMPTNKYTTGRRYSLALHMKF